MRYAGAVVLAFCVFLARADEPPRFRDVRIEKAYAPILRANPILMEVAGAKILRLPSGNQLVIGVGAVALKDSTAKERLRAERVGFNKALASIVAEKVGVFVARVERLEERTVVVIERGKERARSVSDLLQITRAETSGIARGMRTVGRWRSADGQICYVAVAAVCDAKGSPLPGAEPK